MVYIQLIKQDSNNIRKQNHKNYNTNLEKNQNKNKSKHYRYIYGIIIDWNNYFDTFYDIFH